MKARLISTSLVLCSLLPFTACADGTGDAGRTFAYSNLNFGDGFVIDEGRRAVMSGDTGIPAKFCDSQSEYYCVNSNYLNFAVPKAFTRDTKSWSQNDFQFTVMLPLRTERFLGKDVDIAVIASSRLSDKGKKVISYFYYSPTYGLLGFGGCLGDSADTEAVKKHSFPVVMIAADGPGFGAKQ